MSGEDTLVASLARAQLKFGARLISKIDFGPHPTGCWLWIAAKDPHGYGRVWDGRRVVSAHRLTYQILVGPIENELDHLCFTPSCVNPVHLDDVTHHENLKRAAARITHCPHGHDYGDPKNLAVYGGVRECLACARIKAARKRAENPPVLKPPYSDPRTCEKCGEPYLAVVTRQRYCTKACSGVVHHERWKERRRGK